MQREFPDAYASYPRAHEDAHPVPARGFLSAPTQVCEQLE